MICLQPELHWIFKCSLAERKGGGGGGGDIGERDIQGGVRMRLSERYDTNLNEKWIQNKGMHLHSLFYKIALISFMLYLARSPALSMPIVALSISKG